MLRKLFRAKKDSADEQESSAGEQEGSADEQQTQATGEAVADIVTPVQTTTESGAPTTEWATLARVPVPQAVPAAPGQYIAVPAELSEVSAATVARLVGDAQASPPRSEDQGQPS